MPRAIFTETTSGSSYNRINIIDLSNIVGFPRSVRGQDMATPKLKFWLVAQTENLTSSEREFREQERLFQQITPLFLEPYRGLYIAAHDGEIVDSDADLDTLTNRFFTENGDVPVYVTRVGEEMEEVIDTPFSD